MYAHKYIYGISYVHSLLMDTVADPLTVRNSAAVSKCAQVSL